MVVLGLESSADETAAAIVKDGHDMLASAVASSLKEQIKYGGVVPEVAARSHLEVVIGVVDLAIRQSGCQWTDIDAVAVTFGPGLEGSLLIGVMTARTLAMAKNKPLIGVNHVWAHTYANFITDSSLPGFKLPQSQPDFPLLNLIVSGGHTQLVLASSHTKYRLLGRTLDDAVGEAFDKVAKLTGLPYPGGPAISEAAKQGDATRFAFPVAGTSRYDFSFSGLKTAVLRQAQSLIGEDFSFPSYKLPGRLKKSQVNDLAASFQAVAVKTLVDKTLAAYREYRPASLALAGGVAANSLLRQSLTDSGLPGIWIPDIKLCTDNAAMVASRGCYQLEYGNQLASPLSLGAEPSLQM